MKVAIIGGGICGLYLAWKLAEKEQEVIVFEKRDKIGKEACSGLLSERILDFIPESRKLIQNTIEGVLINFPRRLIKVKFSKKFFLINHAELDRLVSELAKKSGAKIILNQQINSLPEGFDRIIGCDGALSSVRKALNLKEPNLYLGIKGNILKDEFSELSPEQTRNKTSLVETWASKSGFIWKIPRGKKIEYGIMEEQKNAKFCLDEFLKKNNIFLEEIKSSFIPQGLTIRADEKTTLCGDAAGLTKPWSGGGVIWGLTAADILLKNFPDLLKYQIGLKRFFLPEIIFSKIAKKIIYFLGFNLPWILPGKFEIDGDFMKIW